jgi:hypothetical protein
MSELQMTEDDAALRFAVKALFDQLVKRVERVTGGDKIRVGGLIRPQDALMLEMLYRGEVNGMTTVLYALGLTYPGLADDLNEMRDRIVERILELRASQE